MSGLADVLGAVDPLLAPHAADDPPPGRWEQRLGGDRAFTMEAVYEGFLLHYREPRGFDPGMDPDLRLLAGDALYALGLEKLAQTGDLAAVAELADLISLCAQAEAEGRPDAIEPLWEATLAALSPESGAGDGTGARATAAGGPDAPGAPGRVPSSAPHPRNPGANGPETA